MTIFFDKARQRWRYDFELGGARYARECIDVEGKRATSRRAAQDCENAARAAAKIAAKLPSAHDLPFGQLLNDLCEKWQRETGWPDKRRQARELLRFFKAETPIAAIDGARIEDYITFAQQQPLMVWMGGCNRSRDDEGAEKWWKPHPSGKTRSAATVNKYLPLLRAVFERAHNTRDPITRKRAIEDIPPIRDLPKLKRKARPIPDDVLVDVMADQAEHIVEAIKLTLLFGLRRGEAFSLKIAHADFVSGGIRLDAEEVKNSTDAFLPGSSLAMQLLAQLVDQARERGTPYLITWRGRCTKPEKLAAQPWRPIKSPKTAWRTAMQKIEKKYGKRWRWHDIRAAYITQIALTSGPLAAQTLARHSDFKTTQGYIAVADEITRAAAERATERPALKLISN